MSKNRTQYVSNALTVTSYEELMEHAMSFATGQYSLLILLGSPGLGKSQALKACLGNREHLYLDNHASAFGLYQLLYQERDKPVVIDDLDGLYTDRGMVRQIKALCNTDTEKTMRWHSRHPDIGLGPDQIPPEFETRSSVCLIANVWKSLNANIQAIEDRGIVVNFSPTVGEVHLRVRDWFDDEAVYEFMEQNLGLITRPSMRYYIHGKSFRKARPDRWKAMLLELIGIDERIRTLVTLLEDDQYQTEEERIEVFVSKGLGDRSTYYRWKQKLMTARGNSLIHACSPASCK